jgi:hypothetical protein
VVNQYCLMGCEIGRYPVKALITCSIALSHVNGSLSRQLDWETEQEKKKVGYDLSGSLRFVRATTGCYKVLGFQLQRCPAR